MNPTKNFRSPPSPVLHVNVRSLYCCLLKSRFLSTIPTIILGFLFSGIPCLIMTFLKSFNPLLIIFTNFSFLVCLALIKSFTRNNRYRYLKYLTLDTLSAIISFINSCCNFNQDFLCFFGSGASSGVGSRVKILFRFFIGNNMLLKLLRTFSLALKSNTKLYLEIFFSTLCQNSVIQQQNYFAYYQDLLIIILLHVYPLKTIYNEYLPKL